MGYTGARLAPMFSPVPARITAAALAKAGAELLLKETVQNTPVDDSPFPSRVPGTARARWREKPIVGPVREEGEDVYRTGVETEDDVAVYLEYGTGLYGPEHRAYVIRPKDPDGYLRFYSRKNGQWVFAKSVLHPGIHPQRPLATGMVLAEHRMPAHVEPIMHAWIALAELNAFRGQVA